MREDRPSITAALVALARGIGVDGDVPDPIARHMLPPPIAQLLTVLDRAGAARAALRPALRLVTLGLVDHITLRTAAIDAALADAVARGIDQLVILGAGLDARAWRLDHLEEVDVYEVDHPATQGYKVRHVPAGPLRSRSIHFVAVDFERERLGPKLAAAGHDPTRSTFFIWEGVTPYIDRIAVVATLGEVTARSAPGSGIAVTYRVPTSRLGERADELSGLLFRALGEPLSDGLPSSEMLNLLGGASFMTISDTDSNDWAARFGTSAALPFLFRAERLAVGLHEEG